jgi:hypothetical protein
MQSVCTNRRSGPVRSARANDFIHNEALANELPDFKRRVVSKSLRVCFC